MIWLQFMLLAGCIIVAGSKLSRYGDIIAEKTGLGRMVIGVILLAAASSLPELVASATSGHIDNPDLAVGNILGANMLNLFIIAILDFVAGRGPMSYKLRKDHILTAGLGILLTSIILLPLTLKLMGRGVLLEGFRIGPGTILIFIVYLIGIFIIFRYGGREKQPPETLLYSSVSVPRTVCGTVISAMVIVVAGIFLARAADVIAQTPVRGLVLGSSLAGSILLALATTLPELSISLAAIRMGLYDMAVGNLLGSIMFNCSVLFFADISYRRGALLPAASPVHIMTGLLSIMCLITVVLGLIYRSTKAIFRLGWDAVAIVAIYVTWAFLLFSLR